MALPYHLYMLATQMPNQTTIKPMQYGTAFVLLVIVLGVDVVAIIFRSRLRRKNKW